jgi:Zn-dependent protease
MQAAIYASAIRLGRANNWLIFDSLDQGTGFLVIFLTLGVLLNLALAFFNLIPFGPLDGNYIVGLLLPEPLRTRWLQFNRSVGMMGLFMVVIFLRYANISLVGGPVLAGFHFLTGVSLGQ